jgi:hypothetical protein
LDIFLRNAYLQFSTFRPRLVRLISPINTSVHDLILVDSPKFHIVFDFAENLEVYHLTIRGANLGSYDGVDVVGTNYWVHDIEVRNVLDKPMVHVLKIPGNQPRRMCIGQKPFQPCSYRELGLQPSWFWYLDWQS